MKIDRPLLIALIMVCLIGLVALYSASYQLSRDYPLKQLIWLILGSCFLLVVLYLGYERAVDFAYPLYLINILLLIAVLFLGEKRLGAKRWLDWGFFNFQPSEMMKLVLILVLARFLGADKELNPKHILIAIILTGLPCALIFKEPDLGTSLVPIAVLFFILFAAGMKLRYLFWFFLGLISLAPIGWSFLKDYQKGRLAVFLNPNIDPLGAGYTIIQSKIAIGSGGLFGKGWMSGTQNQLNFLPEHHTDFIFSVIGEEWGFAGSVVFLGLYLFIILRTLKIAQLAHEPVGRLICVGVSAYLLGHIFVNVAMTMGLMPVVGLPLLLVSYGGSSVITTMFALGLVLSVGRRA